MRTPRTNPRSGIVVGTLAILVVCVSLAAFLPGARLWGVHHLAFYPLPIRLVAIAFLGASFIPAVARSCHAGLIGAISRVTASGRNAGWIAAAIACISILVFLGLRSATTLLGDGQLILRGYEAADSGLEEVVMNTPQTILAHEPIAKGAMLLHLVAARIATGTFNATPGTGLRVLSCVLGGIFVFVLLAFLRHPSLTLHNRVWLPILVCFSGATQLFFGYIENYTALTLITMVYVVMSLMALRDLGPLWPAPLLFLLAVFTHIQGVLLTPSLVLLLAWRFLPSKRDLVLKTVMPALTLLMLIWSTIQASRVGETSVYRPFLASNDVSGLLTPVHLLDVLNQILLLLPVFPVVLVMLFAGSGGQVVAAAHADKRTRDAGRLPLFHEPVEWHFAFGLSLPCFLYLLTFHAEIGVARDWDLFSLLGPGLIVLTLLILNRAFGTSAPSAQITVPALVVTVVLGTAWFGINASAQRSATRLQSILAYDHSSAPYAYENLAILFEQEGNQDKAIEMMRKATEISRNPRQFLRLAILLERTGQLHEAIGVLDEALSRQPDLLAARRRHVMLLVKTKDYEKLLESSQAGIRDDPDEPLYHLCSGDCLLRAGRIEEGLAALETCLSLNPPADARQWIQAQLKLYPDASSTPRAQ